MFTSQDCLCARCRLALKRVRKTLAIEGIKVRALYVYTEELSRWMMRIKDAHDRTLAPVLIHPFVHRIRWRYRHATFVMVPSSSQKTKERGYHALEEMLKPLDVDLLDLFEKDDIKQSKGSRRQRLDIETHIRLKPNPQPLKRVVLVDDVLTTGASVLACAKLLKPHCEQLEVFVLCLHPLWLKKPTTYLLHLKKLVLLCRHVMCIITGKA